MEQGRPWAHLVELVVNANTTAYLTSHPETLSYNDQTYMPFPMLIGEEQQTSDGELPRMFVDVWNIGGEVFRFAKDNDLSLNDCTIRLINTTLTTSGQDDRIKLQILGAAFVDEIGRFSLGYRFNYEAEGPGPTWNRRDYPSIPFNFKNYGIVG